MTPATPTVLDESKPKKKSAIPMGRIIIVLICGVLLYFGYALYQGFGEVRAGLSRFHWIAFGLACSLAFGNYVLRFLKWEFYLARLDIRGVKKADSFLIFLSGFVLTVSPGKVGEVFKSFVLSETYGVPVQKTAPIVIAERVTDLIGIICLILAGSVGFHGGLVPAAVGGALVLTLLIVVMWRSASLWMISLVKHLPGKLGKIGPKLATMYETLGVLVQPKNLVLPTILSIAAWSLECLSLWTILWGFGERVPVPLATFFYATSTLVGAVLPGGLGVTESALREQMIDIGHIPSEVSTDAMMLVRFATLWFAVVVGFTALGILKRRYPKLLKDD